MFDAFMPLRSRVYSDE
jgi:hypothetical protein